MVWELKVEERIEQDSGTAVRDCRIDLRHGMRHPEPATRDMETSKDLQVGTDSVSVDV